MNVAAFCRVPQIGSSYASWGREPAVVVQRGPRKPPRRASARLSAPQSRAMTRVAAVSGPSTRVIRSFNAKATRSSFMRPCAAIFILIVALSRMASRSITRLTGTCGSVATEREQVVRSPVPFEPPTWPVLVLVPRTTLEAGALVSAYRGVGGSSEPRRLRRNEHRPRGRARRGRTQRRGRVHGGP